jgi:hypothetical protein
MGSMNRRKWVLCAWSSRDELKKRHDPDHSKRPNEPKVKENERCEMVA